jgi:hypothetical protein
LKTYLRSTGLPEPTKAARAESVKFSDGMIVTADDLGVSQDYSVSLMKTVLRAYLGCGVVCGLGLRKRPSPDGGKPSWVVCVDRGVAIDCQGYPIELCAPIELDLSPDACDCDDPPDQVYLLLRRLTSEEAPRDACSCDTDAPTFDCRRVRDYVQVKAISSGDLEIFPDGVCRRPPRPKQNDKRGTDEKPKPTPACEFLTACPDCNCGVSWVLLGSVGLAKDQGIVRDPDMSERRWVKPTEALCSDRGDWISSASDRIAKLEARVDELSKPAAATSEPSAAPAPSTT